MIYIRYYVIILTRVSITLISVPFLINYSSNYRVKYIYIDFVDKLASVSYLSPPLNFGGSILRFLLDCVK